MNTNEYVCPICGKKCRNLDELVACVLKCRREKRKEEENIRLKKEKEEREKKEKELMAKKEEVLQAYGTLKNKIEVYNVLAEEIGKNCYYSTLSKETKEKCDKSSCRHNCSHNCHDHESDEINSFNVKGIEDFIEQLFSFD